MEILNVHNYIKVQKKITLEYIRKIQRLYALKLQVSLFQIPLLYHY